MSPDNGAKDAKGTKAPDPAAVSGSVVDTPTAQAAAPPTYESSLLWFIAQAASEITQWGRNPRLRDRQLREFYPTESYFTSALGTVSARNSAFSWALDGGARVVSHIQDVLDNANMGKGWQDLILKTSVDLYTQDNGAFWEIVRQGSNPDGVVVGINHLDAAHCWHTGDPMKPVVYQNRKGSMHLLPWYNVVEFAELPVPIEKLPGIQLCALTRLLRAAEILRNITTYEHEKTGGRFTRAVHLIKGVASSEIDDAIKQVQGQADQMGLVKYIQPLMVGSVDPKADVGHDTIELASMTDNFSKEQELKIYITIVAMAFLSDYQDFAPLPGGNLGTSTQSEVLHMKARGRGPALFMAMIKRALNIQVLPRTAEFRFDEQDLEADETQADIRKKRAERRKIDIESGVLNKEVARQEMLDAGDLTQEQFDALNRADAEEAADVAAMPVQPIGGQEEVEGQKAKEVPQPARAGPFRGAAVDDGESAACCGSEGSCCYSAERNPQAPARS